MKTNRTILYAEDSQQDVEMTLAALAEYRLTNQIINVPDGEDALDYLYRRGRHRTRPPGNPTLILLDLKMPKVDGIEVLRVIKNDDIFKTIPVVMLTSSREESDVIKSYRLGVNAYVVKPVDFQRFVEAVRQLGAFWTVHNEPPPGATAPSA